MRKFNREARFSSVTLDAKGLRHLAALVRDPASAEGGTYYTFFTVSSDLESLQVSSESVDDFLAHEELPSVLTDVALVFSQRTADDTREIRLFCRPGYVSLHVEGTEQEWVYGRFEVIRGFLAASRGWPAVPIVWVRRTLAAIPFPLGAVIGWAIPAGHALLAATAALGAVSAAGLYLLFSLSKAPILSSTRVNLKPSRELPWSVVLLASTVIAAVAAVIQVVLQLVSKKP
jgi:hypothetical protein